MFRSSNTSRHVCNLLAALKRGAVVEGPRGCAAVVEQAQASASTSTNSYTTASFVDSWNRADSRGQVTCCSEASELQSRSLKQGNGGCLKPFNLTSRRPLALGAIGSCSGVKGTLGGVSQDHRPYSSYIHRGPGPGADDPGRARDLQELLGMVERSAQHWARTGQLHVFMTAFSRAAKVGSWGTVQGSMESRAAAYDISTVYTPPS